MLKLFTKHPHSKGEFYSTHLFSAIKYSLTLARLSLVVLIHGVFPFMFETTTSSKIKQMSEEMSKSRWQR